VATCTQEKEGRGRGGQEDQGRKEGGARAAKREQDAGARAKRSRDTQKTEQEAGGHGHGRRAKTSEAIPKRLVGRAQKRGRASADAPQGRKVAATV
jgi:hypothetical protein